MRNQHISGTVQAVPPFSGVEKLSFNHPELHRINTQRNQRCCDLQRRCVVLWKYQGAVRQKDASVKSRLHEKNFTNNEKKSNSKPVDSVSLLGYFISKEEIAPDPKNCRKHKEAKAPTNNKPLKELELFVELATFYGRTIPYFATKMLPLKNMRNSHFSWDQLQ